MNPLKHWAASVYNQTIKAKREKGLFYTYKAIIREIFKIFFNPIEFQIYKKFKSHTTFSLQGKEYKYFYHFFNLTWANERCVEIPIIWSFIEQYKDKNVLEIGNVLSNYLPIKHDVLDKYEIKPGIINADVADFNTDKKYNLIVSISTIEHVGWDEEEKDPLKIIRSIENLKKCLASEGKMVVTTSLGYNTNLDRMLQEKELKFDEQYYLKRVSRDNRWIQIEQEQARNSRYAYPYPSGNVLFVGIITVKK